MSFITFNYDRSLEQFLFEAIRCHFGKTPEECVKKMDNFPIIHIYGQIGLLPWQDQSGTEYSPKIDVVHRLRLAIESIKLINDERSIETSEEFQKAYQLIREAEQIFILGFGFDETNLERLQINLMKGKQVAITTLGIEPTKLRWIRDYFNNKAQLKIDLTNDIPVLQLLQNKLTIE